MNTDNMSNKAINDGSKDAKVLCQVLKNARELKLDYQTLAADFGMTSTTNVYVLPLYSPQLEARPDDVSVHERSRLL